MSSKILIDKLTQRLSVSEHNVSSSLQALAKFEDLVVRINDQLDSVIHVCLQTITSTLFLDLPAKQSSTLENFGTVQSKTIKKAIEKVGVRYFRVWEKCFCCQILPRHSVSLHFRCDGFCPLSQVGKIVASVGGPHTKKNYTARACKIASVRTLEMQKQRHNLSILTNLVFRWKPYPGKTYSWFIIWGLYLLFHCRIKTVHRSVEEIIHMHESGQPARLIDRQACAYLRQHYFNLTVEVTVVSQTTDETLGHDSSHVQQICHCSLLSLICCLQQDLKNLPPASQELTRCKSKSINHAETPRLRMNRGL